jgi:hypothetical protein
MQDHPRAVESDLPPPRPHRRWIVWVGLLLAVPALAVTLLLLGVQYWQARWRREINRHLADLRAAGVPLTAEEQDSAYQLPPDADDCTGSWLGAFADAQAVKLELEESGLPYISGNGPRDAPLPGEDWAQLVEAEALIDRMAPTLDRLHDAAQRGGGARYPTAFVGGREAIVDWMGPARTATQLLAVEAYVHAHRGDRAGALRSIETIQAVARSLDQHPDQAPLLIRVAIDSTAVDTLRRLLPTLDLDDDKLAAIQQREAAIDYQSHLAIAMRGERINVLAAFADPSPTALDEYRRVNPEGEAAIDVLRDKSLRDYDLWGYLDACRRFESVATGPLPVAWSTAASIAEEVDAEAAGEPALRRQVTSYLAPLFQFWCEAICRPTALRDMAIYALAAERYRLRHGQWPEALSDITADLLPAAWANRPPVDPFDGQPLRYRIDDDGLRLYSVGRNGRDDGGREDFYKGDVVFHIAR